MNVKKTINIPYFSNRGHLIQSRREHLNLRGPSMSDGLLFMIVHAVCLISLAIQPKKGHHTGKGRAI